MTTDPQGSAAACRWCGAKNGEPHDGATHDAYAASDPPGVGYNAPDTAASAASAASKSGYLQVDQGNSGGKPL